MEHKKLTAAFGSWVLQNEEGRASHKKIMNCFNTRFTEDIWDDMQIEEQWANCVDNRFPIIAQALMRAVSLLKAAHLETLGTEGVWAEPLWVITKGERYCSPSLGQNIRLPEEYTYGDRCSSTPGKIPAIVSRREWESSCVNRNKIQKITDSLLGTVRLYRPFWLPGDLMGPSADYVPAACDTGYPPLGEIVVVENYGNSILKRQESTDALCEVFNVLTHVDGLRWRRHIANVMYYNNFSDPKKDPERDPCGFPHLTQNGYVPRPPCFYP